MATKLEYEVVPISEVSKEDLVVLYRKNQPTVLVVDDERVIADTLSIILSKSGFSIMTAYDGTGALALARAVSPDLLLSDVMMPGITGVDLAIMVTEIIPTCRVLLFSGQAATVDLLKTARDQGRHFTSMTKPVHPTDMLGRISEMLGRGEDIFARGSESAARSKYAYQ
jgi:DNA-binding response OmpR family regulator